jgi:hypothetical protein
VERFAIEKPVMSRVTESLEFVKAQDTRPKSKEDLQMTARWIAAAALAACVAAAAPVRAQVAW